MMNPADKTIEGRLADALAHHRAGRLTEAEEEYATILEIENRNLQVLTLLGTLHAQRGDFEEAVRLLGLSLIMEPRQPFALNSLGNALNSMKRHEEALISYEQAIAMKPDHAAAHNNRANALRALKRLDEALAGYDEAIAMDPNYAQAHGNRADVLSELRRYDEAVLSYDKAILLEPNKGDFYNSRASALQALKRHEEALANFEQAIACGTDFASVYFNKALALQALERNEEALASYDHAISLRHDLPAAYNNRGTTLAWLRRSKDALASYDKAIAMKPDYVEAYNNRGLLLHELNRVAEAVESYDAALSFCSNDANIHCMRANALREVQRFDEALASIEKAIALDSGLPYVLGQRLVIKTQACDWNELEQVSNEVISAVARGSRASSPFPLLSLPCPLDIQRKCAEIFIHDLHPGRSKPAVVAAQQDESALSRRLRVAYLSGDFRVHPVAFLIAGVFEQHDRKRFEVHALSFVRSDGSETRARLEKAVEHFIDVGGRPDIEVATLLRERNIDIAVDLTGFTKDRRTGIFALRAAPIQVNYLGYPGTMGADYIDYIIADRIVIPEDEQRHYAEKLVYLPDTYQCNDSKRRIENTTLTRTEAGLPADGFVFCSFNNNFKIRPEMFDVWMRILQRTEGSVLWLLRSNARAERNLRREAEVRGVSGERLVFAPWISNSVHLARQRLADLFLDTLPYGAHTTASDALCAGLPVLTCLGASFAGRVGASLLNAIGLPEMVTHSLAQYEARAVALAHDRSDLTELKAKLAKNRETHPLFDTARFTRHLETAYARMVERHRSGDLPEAFSV